MITSPNILHWLQNPERKWDNNAVILSMAIGAFVGLFIAVTNLVPVVRHEDAEFMTRVEEDKRTQVVKEEDEELHEALKEQIADMDIYHKKHHEPLVHELECPICHKHIQNPVFAF